jgi:hypothetical protein
VIACLPQIHYKRVAYLAHYVQSKNQSFFLRLLNRASILWGESGMQGLAPLTEREVSSHTSLSQNPLEMETFSIRSIAN